MKDGGMSLKQHIATLKIDFKKRKQKGNARPPSEAARRENKMQH